MKELGYKIFAILYRIFCIFPIKDNQVFLIMTHDAGPEGNVAVMREHMKKLDKGYCFQELKREDTHFGKSFRKMWHFFIVDSYYLARSRYVFLDNMFLPMAFLHFRKQVSVVQLWHGTGVIKKIGADTNTGRLQELESLANQNNTHLIVSSETMKHIYGQSFSMPEHKIYVTGMPRADVFFNRGYREGALQEFYREYPMLLHKKLVLYAPTFRDSQVKQPQLELDVEKLAKQLPKDCVVGLRLHPFVAKNYEREKKKYSSKEESRVIDFSLYPSLNTLLFATTLLISDYSSIVFEYAALERPMLYYAYDLEEFEQNSRGFYWDYKEYVPGPVVTDSGEVASMVKYLLDMTLEQYKGEYPLETFLQSTYKYRDCHAAERLAEVLGI